MTYVPTHICMYVCTYVCMYVCTYVFMYVCMYGCMYVCTDVCMYVRMYVCMQCFPQYTWNRVPCPVCFSESNIFYIIILYIVELQFSI